MDHRPGPFDYTINIIHDTMHKTFYHHSLHRNIMILVTNEQNAININTDQLKKDTAIILADLGYDDFDIGILLTTDEHMHEINKQFRNKDKSTDILSFPFYPDLKAGMRIDAQTDDEKNLGDIILAPQYIQQTLDQWDQTFDERMQALLVHGVCHLLGYDHIKDEDYAVMKKEEERLLKALKR